MNHWNPSGSTLCNTSVEVSDSWMSCERSFYNNTLWDTQWNSQDFLIFVFSKSEAPQQLQTTTLQQFYENYNNHGISKPKKFLLGQT